MPFRDDGAALRRLTIEFFTEGLETFKRLKHEMDDFPDSEEALRDWLGELTLYSRRAQDLCDRWRRLHPELEPRTDTEPDEPGRHLKQTPYELPGGRTPT